MIFARKKFDALALLAEEKSPLSQRQIEEKWAILLEL